MMVASLATHFLSLHYLAIKRLLLDPQAKSRRECALVSRGNASKNASHAIHIKSNEHFPKCVSKFNETSRCLDHQMIIYCAVCMYYNQDALL
jgi:hypothetical protein